MPLSCFYFPLKKLWCHFASVLMFLTGVVTLFGTFSFGTFHFIHLPSDFEQILQ